MQRLTRRPIEGLPNKGLVTDQWVRYAHPMAAQPRGVSPSSPVSAELTFALNRRRAHGRRVDIRKRLRPGRTSGLFRLGAERHAYPC